MDKVTVGFKVYCRCCPHPTKANIGAGVFRYSAECHGLAKSTAKRIKGRVVRVVRYLWTTYGGSRIALKDMELSHLANVLGMLERRRETTRALVGRGLLPAREQVSIEEDIKRMERELKRRAKSNG